MADNKRSKIEAIWEEPETPTYITDPEYLADITSDREDSVIEDLLEKAEAIKNEAKGNGIKIIETYFGKTYIGEVEEGFDRTNPDTWNFEGIKSRFTSHKTPKDIIAQRNMIILTTVIMDDSVPDEIKQEYDRLKLEDPKTPASKPATQINVTNTTPTKEPRSQRDKSATPERGIVSPPPPKKKTKATCPAEFYALEIERTLFSQYMESAAEQRDTEGRTGKHDGYVVYMRITHSEREEVRNIPYIYRICFCEKRTKLNVCRIQFCYCSHAVY